MISWPPTNSEKLRRVDSIIQELGLKNVENTKIGSELVRGVSGGERKRVSVGVELVTDPSLVFLDEPTSGRMWTQRAASLASMRGPRFSAD